MKFKERIIEALKTYFILVTLITVFLMVAGLLFDKSYLIVTLLQESEGIRLT